MLSPRQNFEDNIYPAELLLRVYRLLENDSLLTSGAMVTSLRQLVQAGEDEELMLIYNEIFLGLVRERAQLPPSALKKSALCNLLRQAVVVACTALETFLPSLLRQHLPTIILIRGRDFVSQDKEIAEYFSDLKFDLSEILRIMNDPKEAPLYLANKVLGLTGFKYLSSRKGIHVVGALLGLDKPWEKIANRLQREKKELMEIVDDTTRRRNDIVHRADRPQADPAAEHQEITYSWAKQAVDTVTHVCFALDELTTARMVELRTLQQAQ